MSFPKPFNLDRKVALVTGAASGLGVIFAEAMAEAGADVVCADINAKGLQKTVKKIEKIGRKGLAVICDVSKEEEVKKMMKVTVDTFGRLDILSNNAGIAEETPKPLHQYTTEEWNRILAVDLQGVFFCAREALKIMVKQKSGKIINMSAK
jgi:NAD(P)-dependent dehydrogenase (short-subunit alcohol dehydrogenase family)